MWLFRTFFRFCFEFRFFKVFFGFGIFWIFCFGFHKFLLFFVFWYFRYLYRFLFFLNFMCVFVPLYQILYVTIPDWKEGAFFLITPWPCAILCRVEDPDYYNSSVHFLYCVTCDAEIRFPGCCFIYIVGIFYCVCRFRPHVVPCHVTLSK